MSPNGTRLIKKNKFTQNKKFFIKKIKKTYFFAQVCAAVATVTRPHYPKPVLSQFGGLVRVGTLCVSSLVLLVVEGSFLPLFKYLWLSFGG